MFPHSQKAYEGLISLPIYTRMLDMDVVRVAEVLRRMLGG
jgi:dTDP-4-amino-4,6-dideoxygalactose transaminase